MINTERYVILHIHEFNFTNMLIFFFKNDVKILSFIVFKTLEKMNLEVMKCRNFNKFIALIKKNEILLKFNLLVW